jgi:hypothetical protein
MLDRNPTDFHPGTEQAAFKYWGNIDKEISDRIARGASGGATAAIRG